MHMHYKGILTTTQVANHSNTKDQTVRPTDPQSTYRGRGEIGECIWPLSWSAHHNFGCVVR